MLYSTHSLTEEAEISTRVVNGSRLALAPRALAPILGLRAAEVVVGAPSTITLADLDAETSAGLSDDLVNALRIAVREQTRAEWRRVASSQPFIDMPSDFTFAGVELSTRARNVIGRFPLAWLREATIDDLMEVPQLGVGALVELLQAYEGTVGVTPAKARKNDAEDGRNGKRDEGALYPLAPRQLAPILAKPSGRYAATAPPGRLSDLDLATSLALPAPLAEALNRAIVRLVREGWKEVEHEPAFPGAPAGFNPLSLSLGIRARNCLVRSLPTSGASATVGELMAIPNFGGMSLLEIMRAYEVWQATTGAPKASRRRGNPEGKPKRALADSQTSFAGDVLARPLTERVRSMYSSYEAGATLSEIAARFRVSRERVRQLFRDADLPTRSVGEAAELKRKLLADSNRERIIEAFLDSKTPEAIAGELGIPLRVVREVVAEDPRHTRILSARTHAKRTEQRYSDDDLIDCLRSASLEIGGVLTTAAYSALAKTRSFRDARPWPTHQTPSNRFGSWRGALQRAGLQSNPPSAIAGQRIFTREHCIEAILEVERALGRLPTAADYERYAAKMGGALPSLATLRHRCGGWREALMLAVEFS